MSDRKGILVAIVGPSGAGKDTLLDAARKRLDGDVRFVFPRRVITRPGDAGGEDHRPVTIEQFETMRTAGGFALTWEAHGLCYGLPASILDDIAAGRCVVANVSREALGKAREIVGRLAIVVITAPPALLESRLRKRGREGTVDIAERLARASALPAVDASVLTIVNDGTPEAGGERLAQALIAIRTQACGH